METILLNYGLPGVVILGLGSTIGILYRDNKRLQMRIEDLLEKSLQSEHETRQVLEKVVEGLSAQDLITRYIEKLQRQRPHVD